MHGHRYFLDLEPVLAARLDDFLARMAADLGCQPFKQEVANLVLAGGYGRGEGGVFRKAEGAEAELYNDLEFFLFIHTRTVSAALGAWCGRWERDGTEELGIDVEIKRLPARTLGRTEPTMFYFDLLSGNRVVWGNPRVLRDAPLTLRSAQALPLSEPVRLLFNRGSGLLFSRWKLEEDPSDRSGFVQRNIAKAKLALGDAVLAAAGRHSHLALERGQRVAAGDFPCPPNFDRLQQWHAEGVAFKLRPRHANPGAAALSAELEQLVAAWLATFCWLETRRLGTTIAAGSDYVGYAGRLFPESDRLRNVLLHVRDRVKRKTALPRWSDYPRAPLQRALVGALGTGAGEILAARNIGEKPGTWRDSYRRWWACYN